MAKETSDSFQIKHPNRPNARKSKQGGGCKMCKPWKGKWEHKFKRQLREKKKDIDV